MNVKYCKEYNYYEDHPDCPYCENSYWDGSKCVLVTENPIANCINYSRPKETEREECMACSDGFFPLNNHCFKNLIDNCALQYSIFECHTCMKGYGRLKVKKGITDIHDLEKYSEDDLQALDAQTGWESICQYLYPNEKKIEAGRYNMEGNYPENCQKILFNGECDLCNDKYSHSYDGICVESKIPYCQETTPDQEECHICISGYYLTSDLTCDSNDNWKSNETHEDLNEENLFEDLKVLI
jgi:hypothetical protein